MPTKLQPHATNGQATSTEPYFEVVDVTPELAAEWLALNTHNRNYKWHKIGQYARDMAAGNWSFTGEPIKFAPGLLIDGQNRLRAIIEADVTVRMAVARNLEPSAQDDMDTGAGRKYNDVLRLRGETSSEALAALVRKVAIWESGSRTLKLGALSRSQLDEVLGRHPELREIVPVSTRVASRCDLPASLVGLCWWLFSSIPDDPKAGRVAPDEEDVSYFFERLADGQNLIKGNPIYELRRTLDNISEQSRGVRAENHLLAITIKAWNAYREGRKNVGLYRWKPGGANPERFPEPI